MKIRNFKSILIIMATTTALLYTSCTKNDNLNTAALKKNPNQSISTKSDVLDLSNIKVGFKHDMLVFETMEDYQALSKLVSKTNSFDKKLKSIFPTFKSVEDVYYEFIESDIMKNMKSIDEIYLYQDKIRISKLNDEITLDPKLSYEKSKLHNHSGIIQIGKEVIKREYDKVSILSINQINNIDNLEQEFLTNPFVKVEKIQVLTKTNEILEQRGWTTYDCRM